jgi:hypothetical protein
VVRSKRLSQCADQVGVGGYPALRALVPDGVTDLDQFRVQRRDRAGGVIHEYRLVA